jgi:hypothetical protein
LGKKVAGENENEIEKDTDIDGVSEIAATSSLDRVFNVKNGRLRKGLFTKKPGVVNMPLYWL